MSAPVAASVLLKVTALAVSVPVEPSVSACDDRDYKRVASAKLGAGAWYYRHAAVRIEPSLTAMKETFLLLRLVRTQPIRVISCPIRSCSRMVLILTRLLNAMCSWVEEGKNDLFNFSRMQKND